MIFIIDFRHNYKWYFIYRLPWYLRMKFYTNMINLVFMPSNRKKRLLGIYDFKTCPWSVGDPLMFVEELNCLLEELSIEGIDICVIYDNDNPAGIRHNDNLSSENARDYVLDWLPLFSTCQNLDSLFHFKSRLEFNYFLRGNMDRYMIFPSITNHLGETYNYTWHAEIRPMVEFYKKHKRIPHLRIGPLKSSWAYQFFLKHINPNNIPVVLSLKLTDHDHQRNADPSVWLPFIARIVKDHKELSFVFVGLKGEELPGIRKLSNVIIAKDYGTSIIEDLALIQKSFIYIATVSGPNTIALFSDTPYIIFQMPVEQKNYPIKRGENYCFATQYQKLFDTTYPMSAEFIYDEFQKVYEKLDIKQWLATAKSKSTFVSQHPSTHVLNTEKAE